MELKYEVKGIPELVSDLKDLGIRRIPNYVARAMTALADRVQDAMISETQRGLTVRGTWLRKGTRFGINRKAATKDNLTATVSSIAPWLVSEELDDTRRAQSGDILIPLSAVRTGRTDPRVLSRRYRALTRSRSHNLIKFTNDKGQTILYEHGTTLKRHFLPLFLLKRSAPIPKRVALLPVGEGVVNKLWDEVAGKMVEAAIAEKTF